MYGMLQCRIVHIGNYLPIMFVVSSFVVMPYIKVVEHKENITF